MTIYKKVYKCLDKYTNTQKIEWFNKVIDFIKRETDIEVEFIKDSRNLNGNFFNYCEIKDGKILVTKYGWHTRVFEILHEAGHLASIPKKHRAELNSRLAPKKKYSKKSELWKGLLEDSWGDESLAQYWARCVAEKLNIPIYPFNMYFAEPYKSQQEVKDNLGVRGYYFAKKLGLSTKIFTLNKNNI